MYELKWSPVFEIGVEEIDADHRRLFAMANDVRKAIVAGDRANCVALVDEFLAMAAKHFADEEDYLLRVGYAETAQHAAHHATLLDRAKELHNVYGDTVEMNQAELYYCDLLVFIIDDVVRVDQLFKSYLEHKGLTKSR